MRTMSWKWAASGVGAVAFTLTSGQAGAFFPPVPLASNDPVTITVPPPPSPIVVVPPTSTPPVLIPPVPIVPPVVVPPVPPPPFVPPSPPNLPQSVPPTCTCHHPTPQTVPEPATMLSGLIGLGAVAAGAARRRAKSAG